VRVRVRVRVRVSVLGGGGADTCGHALREGRDNARVEGA